MTSCENQSAILAETMKRRPCWCTKPILWEFIMFPFCFPSFCANNFAELLFTWLKRLYRGILCFWSLWFYYLPGICSLPDELLIKDLVTYQSDVMTMLADRLSVGQVPWDYEWRRLARQLKIPYAVYRKFEWKPRKRRKSPTKKVLQWLVERIPDITLTEIIAVLDKIECSHAIQIIKEHFPNTVGEYSTWEHRAPVHSCYVWPWFRLNRPSLPQTYPEQKRQRKKLFSAYTLYLVRKFTRSEGVPPFPPPRRELFLQSMDSNLPDLSHDCLTH